MSAEETILESETDRHAAAKVASHDETGDRVLRVATPLRQQQTGVSMPRLVGLGHRQPSPRIDAPAASSLREHSSEQHAVAVADIFASISFSIAACARAAKQAAQRLRTQWVLLVAAATELTTPLRERLNHALAESDTYASLCAAMDTWAQAVQRTRAQWLQWLQEGDFEEAEEEDSFGLFQPEVVSAQVELTMALAALLEEGGNASDKPESTQRAKDAGNDVVPWFSYSIVIQRSFWAILVFLSVTNVLTPFVLLLAGSPIAPAATVAAVPVAQDHVVQPSVAPPAVSVYEDVESANSTMNATAAMHQLWAEGHKYLTHSRCREAEELFSAALEIVDSNPDVLAEEHQALISDRAFALVCSLRYNDATKYIEAQWSNISATHVLNAAGYAYFKQRNYVSAGAAFKAALQADPHNKIMWSNLAAAHLLAGNLKGADDAMYYATDPSNTYFHGDEWFNGVIFTNVKVLLNHAMGQKADKPLVELWYDQASAR